MNTDITRVLNQWFRVKCEAEVNVIIAGRVFGGRLGEALQRPSAVQIVGPVVVIRFVTAERLVITDPCQVRIGECGELIIPNALDVRFGWYYYGKPQNPENWCELIYRRDGSQVTYVSTGSLRPGVEVFEYAGDEFVKLL